MSDVFLESKVENAVVKWAEKQGILCFKFTPLGIRGWPDRMFIYCGTVVFIEFKAVGQKLRKLQAYRLQQLTAAGVDSIWSNNYEESISFLQKHLNPIPIK